MAELEKYIQVEKEWKALEAFLTWMNEARGILFVTENSYSDGYEEGHDPIDETNRGLLALYFGIDLDVLNQEEQAILEERRESIRRRRRIEDNGG